MHVPRYFASTPPSALWPTLSLCWYIRAELLELLLMSVVYLGSHPRSNQEWASSQDLTHIYILLHVNVIISPCQSHAKYMHPPTCRDCDRSPSRQPPIINHYIQKDSIFIPTSRHITSLSKNFPVFPLFCLLVLSNHDTGTKYS